jgi:hypothetical protein
MSDATTDERDPEPPVWREIMHRMRDLRDQKAREIIELERKLQEAKIELRTLDEILASGEEL